MFLNRTHRLAALAAFQLSAFPLAALAQQEQAAGMNLPAIVVTQATARLLTDRIVATGSVKPVEEVYIQPQVEGLQIRSLNADTGDRVKEGDLLATLADDSLLLQKSQMQATRAKAEANLAQLQAQLPEARSSAEEADRQNTRAKALGAKGTMSTSQVEQAATAATGARARLNAAEQAITAAQAELKVIDAQISDLDLKLARTGIKAPAPGIISARNARIGAIASASGSPLFTLIRDGNIELVADVTESEVLKIRVGQKAILRVAGNSETIHGSVRLVSPTVDSVTRLGAVHIIIEESGKARSGMYASAEIVTGEANGLALPLSAITMSRNGATVRMVRDGVVHQVRIETGIQDSGFMEVKSGLEPGAEVVAKAGAFVRDGDRITPVKQAASGATD